MKINFSPIRSDDDLSISVSGDIVTINGDPLDLSVIPTGATLPHGAIDSEWIAGPIERDDAGILTVTIRLPHAHNAPEARRFPVPIIVTEDGPITLPDNTPEAPDED